MGFNYLQNNKTLKPIVSPLRRLSGFNYLQNNKTLKPQIISVNVAYGRYGYSLSTILKSFICSF